MWVRNYFIYFWLILVKSIFNLYALNARFVKEPIYIEFNKIELHLVYKSLIINYNLVILKLHIVCKKFTHAYKLMSEFTHILNRLFDPIIVTFNTYIFLNPSFLNLGLFF